MTLTRRHALALGAALPLAAPGLALAQPREMRLGILTPPGHPWNLTALRFGEQLKAATNNRLSLTVFHAGQLGSEAAMLQQMQSGALDMGWIMAAELGSRVPAIAAITAPWVVRTTAQVGEFVKTPVATGLFDLLPRETGTIGLGWGITGMRVMFSTKDISSLGEVRGLKIRTIPSPTFRDFYTALGAAPTPIPTPAVFDAMTNGQVDGLEADLAFSWNQRFDRVSKVILGMNAQFMPVAALVSGRVWAGLPAADKEIITRLIKSNLDQQIAELVADEPRIIESFRAAPIPIRPIAAADTDAAVRAFDQIWLERAPVLREMRRVGATLA
ncbi:TRAP transporter substrate-binding protein [Roseococcus sp. YIM B11640]|uniref:TRAP transporter substrate-binding protein n=1 Tax=Roseococcus sp. YIM B11640 TaxID=3133973 RepID=UPI003C7C7C3C